MNLSDIKWTSKTYNDFLIYLKSFQDKKYREFHSHLIPDCPVDKFIGIRTPVLRKIGKEISKGDYKSFLEISGNDYYEETIIKAVIIGLIKVENSNQLCDLLDFYAPMVDSWATCDMFCSSFKEVKKYKNDFLIKIEKYLNSPDPWYIRLALVLLLTYFLDDKYIETALKLTDNIKSDFYYVSMAQAWLVATAFAKNETVTMNFFKNCKLDDVTFNRSIQKAKESYRVSKDCKAKLSKMKRTLDK